MNEGSKMLHPLLSGIFIRDQNGTSPPSPNFKLQTRELSIPPLNSASKCTVRIIKCNYPSLLIYAITFKMPKN